MTSAFCALLSKSSWAITSWPWRLSRALVTDRPGEEPGESLAAELIDLVHLQRKREHRENTSGCTKNSMSVFIGQWCRKL